MWYKGVALSVWVWLQPHDFSEGNNILPGTMPSETWLPFLKRNAHFVPSGTKVSPFWLQADHKNSRQTPSPSPSAFTAGEEGMFGFAWAQRGRVRPLVCRSISNTHGFELGIPTS